MIQLSLIGGRGYTGEQLLRLIDTHPDFELVRIGSRSLAGQAVRSVFPDCASQLVFEALTPEDLAADPGDGVILALSNGQSGAYVAQLPVDLPVIDLSADHRFDDSWAYGLPELDGGAIAGAKRVANPGCYATAAQIALAPIAQQLDAAPSIFGVSGFSGAGRTPSDRNDPQRLRDNLLPYALTGHLHEREISHRLGQQVRFSPHVAPFFRGLSVTMMATLHQAVSRESLLAEYSEFYADEPLIDVTEHPPEIQAVVGTHRAQVGGFAVDDRDQHRVVVVAVLDNLLKGAASQAVQNLNRVYGLPATRGLNND